MANSLVSRGPDSGGLWFDTCPDIGLAHRRLSILDLSPAGNQPMHSHCGRYVVIFNGEIYNSLCLRSELNAASLSPPWRGHSDTEVLTACIAAWGLEATLSRSRGMFALALWDRAEKTLTLARDGMGEKPLYYGNVGKNFVFASELKALRAIPSAHFHTDSNSVALMLRYGYVPAPYSIYSGIYKLPPGTLLSVSANGHFSDPEPWWSFNTVATECAASRTPYSDSDALDGLESVLTAAIQEQSVADVPLGAFLSGGIDSSTVVALMQRSSNACVRTFTVGFDDHTYNESSYAKAVARHLGTEHTELIVDSKQALDVIPHLPNIYDEPFADASQIPTVLLSALTKQYVSVCLSGDAGVELFGGYNRYLLASSVFRRIQPIPIWLRLTLASSLSSVPAPLWNSFLSKINILLPQSYRFPNYGDQIHKLAAIIGFSSPESLYTKLVSQWRGPLPLNGIVEPPAFYSNPTNWPVLPTFTERMMSIDAQTYLPDDILVKVDRAAMSSSLETRVPFLDNRVIQFALRLPLHQKVRDGQGKWLLRQLLFRYLPQDLVDRPKQGFAVPIESWLRGPLRDWAEDLLAPSSLAADGILDPLPIRLMWNRHLSGRNSQYALWNILMYQAWRRRWH